MWQWCIWYAVYNTLTHMYNCTMYTHTHPDRHTDTCKTTSSRDETNFDSNRFCNCETLLKNSSIHNEFEKVYVYKTHTFRRKHLHIVELYGMYKEPNQQPQLLCSNYTIHVYVFYKLFKLLFVCTAFNRTLSVPTFIMYIKSENGSTTKWL